jgi:ornithine carbamoyltransferase
LNELPKSAIAKWFWWFQKHSKEAGAIRGLTVWFVWLNKLRRSFGWVCHSKTVMVLFTGMEVVVCSPLHVYIYYILCTVW